MNSFWTVVSFTARNKFKAKSFLITTLILVVILSIGINLPAIISLFDKGGDNKAINIGYAIQSDSVEGNKLGQQLKDFYQAQENSEVKLIEYPDAGSVEGNEKAMKAGIADNKIKGYLTFGTVTDSGIPSVTYKSEKLLDSSATQSLEAALQTIKQENVLKDAGLTDAQKVMLFAPIKLDSIQIAATDGAGSAGNGKSPAQQGVDIGLVTVMMMLLFFAIMITGQLIASEITAEKSSRVMEILVTSVSPLKQMFGKIFGMFLVGLFQIAVYVAVMLININFPHNKEAFADFEIDLSKISPDLLIYALVFYLAGYFLYSTLFAAVGSIVSRTEDLGQAVFPITILSLAGFYIATFSISNPESMLVTISSFIPFFSPFVMLLRLGLTNPPVWQVLLSIGILLVSIYGAGWISAKIYRTGVLMYGKRPSFKELRKAMKAYKV
ncbi:MAG: ABC transporter permease [Candidatus Pristimantibacillus sp.]